MFYYFHNGKYHESNNLKRIAEKVIAVIDGKEKNKIMYQDLIDIIVMKFEEKSYVVEREKIESFVQSIISKKGKTLEDIVEYDELTLLLEKLSNKKLEYKIKDLISSNDLIKVIEQNSTYIPDIDKIVVIGDRDKGSFTTSQYDFVVQKAKEKGFILIITNPYIEFWFLLHHTNALDIDKTSWTICNNVASMVMEELLKFDSNYDKKNFDAKWYVEHLSIAKENIKNYSNSLESLIDTL